MVGQIERGGGWCWVVCCCFKFNDDDIKLLLDAFIWCDVWFDVEIIWCKFCADFCNWWWVDVFNGITKRYKWTIIVLNKWKKCLTVKIKQGFGITKIDLKT